jgi:predicted transposase YdaD
MPDYDAGFKIVAREAGRQLGQIAGVLCHEWEPISETVQTTERLADRAFRARLGRDRFIVYMEAYTRWQSSAPWSMLAKSGLLSERERLPTMSLVFVLLRRGYHSQKGQFRLKVAGSPTQRIWFREVCMWLHEPAAWWDQAPGLMPLYPLCRHRQPGRNALAHAVRTITDRVSDRIVRADLLTTLYIFGKLAYPDVDTLALIGREQMKESKAYQEIMEEGREEGRAEGILQTKRADISEAIEIRFGAEAAAEFQDILSNLDDLQQLSHLHRLAIRSRRLAELRRAFAERTTRRS